MPSNPGPLKFESIEATLRNVIFDASKLVLWPLYLRYPPECQGLVALLAKLGIKIP